MMAQNLGWAQVSFASKEESLEGPEEKAKKPALLIADGTLKAVREVDGGLETTEATLPAVVTTELRLNVPRYASLPGIMKAKKKPIAVKELSEVVGDAAAVVKVLTMEAPAQRAAGVKVDDTAALMDKLRNEAKVI
jgi:electron transfer flavoprotein beta subunit